MHLRQCPSVDHGKSLSCSVAPGVYWKKPPHSRADTNSLTRDDCPRLLPNHWIARSRQAFIRRCRPSPVMADEGVKIMCTVRKTYGNSWNSRDETQQRKSGTEHCLRHERNYGGMGASVKHVKATQRDKARERGKRWGSVGRLQGSQVAARRKHRSGAGWGHWRSHRTAPTLFRPHTEYSDVISVSARVAAVWTSADWYDVLSVSVWVLVCTLPWLSTCWRIWCADRRQREIAGPQPVRLSRLHANMQHHLLCEAR